MPLLIVFYIGELPIKVPIFGLLYENSLLILLLKYNKVFAYVTSHLFLVYSWTDFNDP